MCYATSIWDETLYKAWSSIVYSLIPNISTLESNLEDFCRICDADEVVLFECVSRAATLAHATRFSQRNQTARCHNHGGPSQQRIAPVF